MNKRESEQKTVRLCARGCMYVFFLLCVCVCAYVWGGGEGYAAPEKCGDFNQNTSFRVLLGPLERVRG